MYIWMFALEDRVTLFGRTWEQFQDCLTRINDNLPSKQVLIVWVHNLAYEWQFMRWFFDWQKVFLVGKRKPITARWQNIEFRCSYKQTNMSLDAFTHKMGAKHSKLSGDDFDYKAKRYPWTELSFSQLNYCYCLIEIHGKVYLETQTVPAAFMVSVLALSPILYRNAASACELP